MVFGEGSREVWCSLVYLRWGRDDAYVECRIVAEKTQVAQKVKITIPTMALVAAVISVRLARRVKESLKIPLVGVRYFTDSSAVLRMLRIESRKFNEFMGSWVSEVKVNSDMENEWVWLMGIATQLTWGGLLDRSTALYFYKRLKTNLHKPRGNLLETYFLKNVHLKIIYNF